MDLIRLDAVEKLYAMGEERVRALKGLSLGIRTGEYVAIIGSSGSGKSTIMNILGCLDTPTGGQYILNERNVDSLTDDELADLRNKEIGFIFQSFHLLPRLTALQNVMQPLIYRMVPRQQRDAMARHVLDRVGLGKRCNHFPNQLSGGQRQRVAIARALVTKPSLLLADEPTGNLDTQTTQDIMALFDELHDEGQTIIMVTHEPDIAARCRRVIRLEDGKLVEDFFN